MKSFRLASVVWWASQMPKRLNLIVQVSVNTFSVGLLQRNRHARSWTIRTGWFRWITCLLKWRHMRRFKFGRSWYATKHTSCLTLLKDTLRVQLTRSSLSAFVIWSCRFEELGISIIALHMRVLSKQSFARCLCQLRLSQNPIWMRLRIYSLSTKHCNKQSMLKRKASQRSGSKDLRKAVNSKRNFATYLKKFVRPFALRTRWRIAVASWKITLLSLRIHILTT